MKSLLHKYIWCYLLGFSTFGTYTCCQTSFNFHCRSTMILFSVWIIFVHAVKHFQYFHAVHVQSDLKLNKRTKKIWDTCIQRFWNKLQISSAYPWYSKYLCLRFYGATVLILMILIKTVLIHLGSMLYCKCLNLEKQCI